MEHILVCLRKSLANQDQSSQVQIYSEIVEFIESAGSDRRKYLVAQLCRRELINTLSEGLTSNQTSLLKILKLFCFISEDASFNAYFWTVLKSIGRALAFLANSKEIVQLQVEFTEVVFMVVILMKRFSKQTHLSELNEGHLQILKSLQSISKSVLDNQHLSDSCKLCVFPLFCESLWMAQRLPIQSIENHRRFLHSLIETFCILTENVFPKLAVTNKTLMIFVSVKMFCGMLRLAKDFSVFDVRCIGKMMVKAFKKYYWEYLFEDVSEAVLVNFIITLYNWFTWKANGFHNQIVYFISKICEQHSGIERLIIYLNDEKSDNVLRQKTKLLVNSIAYAGVRKAFSCPVGEQHTCPFFLEEIELFTNLAQVESSRLYTSARSFIFIFYNLLKCTDYNQNDYISIIFLKICSIIKRKHESNEKLTAEEFWCALSIYLICQDITRNRNKEGLKMKLFSKTNEMFRCMLEEDFCIASSLTELEQFEWLKRNNPNWFERSVVNCLSQRIYETDDRTFQALMRLTTPNQMLYLILSENYYQKINSGKMLVLKQIAEEHVHILIQLYGNTEKIDGKQLIGLLYVLQNCAQKCGDKKNVLKIYINSLRSIKLKSSRFDTEIQCSLFHAIFCTIKCYDEFEVIMHNQ